MNAVLPWAGWLAAAVLLTAAQAGTKGPAAVDPAQCKPAGTDLALPAAWEPYRAAVRVCSLAQSGAGKVSAKVRLIAVFTDEHYRGLPADAPWDRFPLPQLVDETGRCLAQLPHLFPVDPPEALEVRPVRWRAGVPQEIQLQVHSPAAGGDSRLPTLRWDAKTRHYRANSATSPATSPTSAPSPDSDKTLCA